MDNSSQPDARPDLGLDQIETDWSLIFEPAHLVMGDGGRFSAT